MNDELLDLGKCFETGFKSHLLQLLMMNANRGKTTAQTTFCGGRVEGTLQRFIL